MHHSTNIQMSRKNGIAICRSLPLLSFVHHCTPDHKLYRVSTVLLLPLFSRKPLTSQPIVPQHETLKDYFLTLPAWPQASLPDYFA
jgi:hypothetical protein